MSADPLDRHQASMRRPLAAPSEIARQDPAYPARDTERPTESLFADWRKRLARNLSRRSDGPWQPLTYVHEARPDIVGDDSPSAD